MVYYTGKPIEKGPRAINKTRYWSANNDFRKAKNQNKLLTLALLNIKSVGFHILLLRVTIRGCHSFRSYKVQSWKAVYISRRCQFAEKDNNCVNFWCRKSLGKLNHVPTSNKTDSFSILDLFYVKIKFLKVSAQANFAHFCIIFSGCFMDNIYVTTLTVFLSSWGTRIYQNKLCYVTQKVLI